MQASLEAEAKAKAEALRLKKKLESDINELEIALDHSNKANADLQKQIKKQIGDIKDLQIRVEEEQRIASEYRDQFGIAERRANALSGELEESRTLLEQSDRGRRQAEADLAEANETVADLNAQINSLGAAKRKLEGEMQTLHVSKNSRQCNLTKLNLFKQKPKTQNSHYIYRIFHLRLKHSLSLLLSIAG